jgi:hypothetical protein
MPTVLKFVLYFDDDDYFVTMPGTHGAKATEKQHLLN